MILGNVSSQECDQLLLTWLTKKMILILSMSLKDITEGVEAFRFSQAKSGLLPSMNINILGLIYNLSKYTICTRLVTCMHLNALNYMCTINSHSSWGFSLDSILDTTQECIVSHVCVCIYLWPAIHAWYPLSMYISQ